MKYVVTIMCLLGALCVLPASARPVSYPTGWTVMQSNDAEQNSLHVHYSPTAKYSIGYRATYWRDEEWQYHGAQLNYLAKRWNMPAAQANMYFKGSAGLARSDFGPFDGKWQAAGFAGVAADWENRRLFTSYENHLMYAGDIDKFFMQSARVGFAPYEGDYGDLHTWLMLQVEHTPTERDPFIITPLVRFFKGVHLAEIGMGEDGDALLNYVVRF